MSKKKHFVSKRLFAVLALSTTVSACTIPEATTETTVVNWHAQNCAKVVNVWNEFLFSINWFVTLWNENVNGVQDQTAVMMEMAQISDKLSGLDKELASVSDSATRSEILIDPIRKMRKVTSNPSQFFADFEDMFPTIKAEREEIIAVLQTSCG